jgi:hypothetical protein
MRALNRAIAAGATRGAMITTEVVNDGVAAKHMRRAAKGTTWLGGKLTRMEGTPDGPRFRIDFDVLLTITE